MYVRTPDCGFGMSQDMTFSADECLASFFAGQ